MKEETSDEDSDTLSMSLNVDFDKLDRNKILTKNRDIVFVTDDGKTAECFEEVGEYFILETFLMKYLWSIMSVVFSTI